MMRWISVGILLTFAAHLAAVPTTRPALRPSPTRPTCTTPTSSRAKIISGAQPEGEESFQALQKLGVKTIISVDGAKPDVETAKKYGMRYVHLPIGYDGVSRRRGQGDRQGDRRDARADLCALPPRQASLRGGGGGGVRERRDAQAGAGQVCPRNLRHRRELQGAVARRAQARAASIRRSFAISRSTSSSRRRSREFAETMVQIDKHWDHLKLIQKAGWKSPANHPDLDPAHEVLQVQEHLHESGRLESSTARPAEFRKMLTDSEEAVKSLHAILSAPTVDTNAADAAFKLANESCTACHKQYRD